ncbi:MAG: tRNA pseudouridine(55) synthase TruB [Culturomica sp.]|jgi:tRNA pseudouridine55 synthase|nr:tRNA pseudouridine(55) synthase TruB [Culturomica sp.]
MILFEEENDFLKGALMLVDKHYGWTSFDVVNKIRLSLRHRYPKLKVGHAGTLDPLATGLVIVCTGKWTKRIDEYMGKMKEYVAELNFGATTPSFDMETAVNKEYPYLHVDKLLLSEVIQKFTGNIEQVPPSFSAIKVNGQRAYRKARQGVELAMEPRKIYVSDIEITNLQLPKAELRINCSKGTYIRSLANDIGQACGSGAYLSALRRTAIGEFQIKNALNLEKLVVLLQQNI